MDSYDVRKPPTGCLSIHFRAQRGDVVPYDFGDSWFIDITQLRDQLTRSAYWWLPVSCVTALIGADSAYDESDITLRLSNGPFAINLSGTDNDFCLLAKELNRAFPRLEKLVMRLRVPSATDLGAFFKTLQAPTVEWKLVAPVAGASPRLASLLESTVLNQITSVVEIDNKLSSLDLSQLQLLGEPNISLLELRLELELNKDDALVAGDWLAKWLFRFQSLKHIEISGDFDVSFMMPFLKALKDGNHITGNCGLAADCVVLEFPSVYGEGDTPLNKNRFIEQECEELVSECIKEWKRGFLWIALGHPIHWSDQSLFRTRLQHEATLKWITEAPHMDETTIRGSDLGHEIEIKDICSMLERAQQPFPPENFRDLFPGMIASDIPIDTECFRNSMFRSQIFFDLIMRNPAMVVAAETAAAVVVLRRPHKRSRSD